MGSKVNAAVYPLERNGKGQSRKIFSSSAGPKAGG